MTIGDQLGPDIVHKKWWRQFLSKRTVKGLLTNYNFEILQILEAMSFNCVFNNED